MTYQIYFILCCWVLFLFLLWSTEQKEKRSICYTILVCIPYYPPLNNTWRISCIVAIQNKSIEKYFWIIQWWPLLNFGFMCWTNSANCDLRKTFLRHLRKPMLCIPGTVSSSKVLIWVTVHIELFYATKLHGIAWISLITTQWTIQHDVPPVKPS